MLESPDLLDIAQKWISRKQAMLIELGISSEVELSPLDREPRSISWVLESSCYGGQLVIWSDGQSEMDLVDMESGEIRSEHRWIESESALASILESIHGWVSGSQSS
jgi:hypothetical protein